MIKEMKALSLAEASEYTEGDVKAFIKKFTKMTPKDAIKMHDEIEKMDNIKIRPEHIAKIIDLMPEDAQDLSKIFSDVSLDEKENAQLLEIVKKYK